MFLTLPISWKFVNSILSKFSFQLKHFDNRPIYTWTIIRQNFFHFTFKWERYISLPCEWLRLDVSRPSSALELAALDVDDLLRVAGNVDEALVVRHRTDHVHVANLGVLVGLFVVNLDLDRLEVSILEQAAHWLAELVQDSADLFSRDRFVHVIGANFTGLAAFLDFFNQSLF